MRLRVTKFDGDSGPWLTAWFLSPIQVLTWSGAETRQETFLMANFNDTYNKQWNEPVPTKRSAPSKALLKSIGVYQRLTSGRPSPCRFYPSCSNYAVEAIETHGAVRGTGLALRRLSRCRPLGPHGIDLVPEPKKARSSKS